MAEKRMFAKTIIDSDLIGLTVDERDRVFFAK